MDTEYKCGKNEYTGKEIYLAAQRRVNLQKIAETLGKPKHPHRYPYNKSKRGKLEFPPQYPCKMEKTRQGFWHRVNVA
ncbi:hypothetical protein HBI56_220390 [Parastagonospora nodorum]|uniref:Uncharacterized protein n=1 Tax=Phaeosphaeria nodorum (strain SN15 / ATCC MYA-4574 / FGSC 10173) TaxID=321614 RepID=A0A7U2HTS3_PHANO|nr:hypothetical protein HBH56_006620 [Parastagonospora nodorum]QRC90493.1 hypothetical protein JI435_425440 [Parastagonospora nodorum SN15]KAH3937814.1 hypothetical protein HBH54_006610 [Parastagonospora nodorum]KAH3940252.1 hypothetical protein HBH53_220600 [Parastagonospora nodorum]KAH3960020.1 hypothetical protein HBH52_238510 [Parastagonospora nodorum]